MNALQELEALDKRNKELAMAIEKATAENDARRYDFKKELHENKIRMIDIIQAEEKRAGITARELKKLVKNRPRVPRYETGVHALDTKLFDGIEIGTLVQLAGESGIGKTHLTLEILSNVASYAKAVFFNFEMGDKRIIKRLDKLLATDEQWDNLIIDKDSRNINALENEIILYARDGIKFFVIDSKMKIEADDKLKEHQQASAITKRLSKLTQQYDIIIFLINQMSEEDIKGKRLAFKGSGDQQYDSDISLFYVKDKESKRMLICNKNRQDEITFKIDLELNKDGKTVERGGGYSIEFQASDKLEMAKL